MAGMFSRDTTLPPHVLSLYEVGILFRERTFCDATYKFGGLAAAHRYLIIAANATFIDEWSAHPEWGLCIWPTGQIFKVIGHERSGPHAQITLLAIPEDARVELTTPLLSDWELDLSRQAARAFQAALKIPPLPEHSTQLWLSRLKCPVGVDGSGKFFECWRYSE